MPKSENQKHFPLILEFWTTPDERIEVETATEGLREFAATTAGHAVKAELILELLTAFTNHEFFQYHRWTAKIQHLQEVPGISGEIYRRFT